ncbi:hypothetical protein [Bosea sp. (in: a-proteobacteria)]|uniref:hypothetical protein n=1 Tax=Bosea sp. (in: a-proteobacteria) TaxID=1871050 RepID=UPI002624E8EA|nr:hypothetical protein [Bosea sp. (in: a-proteobacteria)]MCO5090048.1 hypothetical protein [Bosea sp. (in: a-proteobacteria)]
MTKHQSPREIIESCLKPLGLNEQSPATQEAMRRLLDVFASQRHFNEVDAPQVDLSKVPVIVINELAHGYDA